MRYTVIHLATMEMRVVEELSIEEVQQLRDGVLLVVDMRTGGEVFEATASQ